MKFQLNNVTHNFSFQRIICFKENAKFKRFSSNIREKNIANNIYYKCKSQFNNHSYFFSCPNVYKPCYYWRYDKKDFSFMRNVIEQVKKDMKENKQYQEALKEIKEKTEIEKKTIKIKNKIEEKIKVWTHIKEKNAEAIKLLYNDIHTFLNYSFENVYILKHSKNAAVQFVRLMQKWIITGTNTVNTLKEKWGDNHAFVQLDKWRQEMAIKRYKKKQEKEKGKGKDIGEFEKENENMRRNEKEESMTIEEIEEEKEEKPEKQRNELILVQESAWDKFGSKLKDMPFLNNFFENPLWGKLFGETEMAAALREMKTKDKNFKLSELIYLFEYVISKHIVESYLIGDEETLKLHCGTAAFNSLNASINERKKMKVNLDTNVLIYKNHELKGAQRIEESFPWFIFTFHTQQINCLRNQNDEIIEGKIDDIREVVYTIALSRHPKPETEGLLYPYIIREFAIIGNTPSW